MVTRYSWCLNSTMVRLKLYSPFKLSNGMIRLNSTMVRLKQKQIQKYSWFSNKSQFHYGSIKTSGACK